MKILLMLHQVGEFPVKDRAKLKNERSPVGMQKGLG